MSIFIYLLLYGQYLLLCLFATFISSLMKCPFELFAHFLNLVVCFILLGFKFFVYLDNSPLKDVSFSHSVDFSPLVLLTLSFIEQKL